MNIPRLVDTPCGRIRSTSEICTRLEALLFCAVGETCMLLLVFKELPSEQHVQGF